MLVWKSDAVAETRMQQRKPLHQPSSAICSQYVRYFMLLQHSSLDHAKCIFSVPQCLGSKLTACLATCSDDGLRRIRAQGGFGATGAGGLCWSQPRGAEEGRSEFFAVPSICSKICFWRGYYSIPPELCFLIFSGSRVSLKVHQGTPSPGTPSGCVALPGC